MMDGYYDVKTLDVKALPFTCCVKDNSDDVSESNNTDLKEIVLLLSDIIKDLNMCSNIKKKIEPIYFL